MKIAQIYGVDNPTLKEKVLKFWISEGCMPETEANQRESRLSLIGWNDKNQQIRVAYFDNSQMN